MVVFSPKRMNTAATESETKTKENTGRSEAHRDLRPPAPVWDPAPGIEITRALLAYRPAEQTPPGAVQGFSKEHLRMLFEYAPDAYYLNDAHGNLLDGNKAAEELIGYPRSELLGKNFLHLNLLAPEDLGKAAANLMRTAAGEPTGPEEFRVIRADGRRVVVEIRAYPVTIEGNMMVLAIARDVTARKAAEVEKRRSELELEVLADLGGELSAARTAAQAGEIILGAADRLLGWDASTLDLYDATSNQLRHVLNKDIIDGVRQECPPAYLCTTPSPLAQRVISEGALLIEDARSVVVGRDVIPFGDSNRHSASILFVPIRSGDRVIGLFSLHSYSPGAYDQAGLKSLQNLANHCAGALERIRLQERLLHGIEEKEGLVAQLMRAQRLESVGQLASGIAHDLNNVLTPIMMAVQLLKETCRGSTEQSMLDTMETCTRRGAEIIKQVLLFARGSEVTRVLLRPKQLLQEMAQIARETFPPAIHVQVDYCSKPWLIRACPTQIQQVLMNLCVNARDAMPHGGSLRLSTNNIELDSAAATGTHRNARPGKYVTFKVEDTGSGFSTETRARLFDPFFTTKPAGQGTGLGLPTALGIVENHGGFISVSSAVGKGSSFSVFIPAVERPEDASPQAARPLPPRGNGELVLVVDDELAVRELVRAVLEEFGYQVEAASTGEEALHLFSRQPDRYRGIVVDLLLPGMSGSRLVASLLERSPGVPVMAISGMQADLEALKTDAPGIRCVLRKPFTTEEFLTAVAGLVARPGL